MRLKLAMAFKFATSLTKELKLKFRKFSGLIPTFEKITGGKLISGAFLPSSNPPFHSTFSPHPLLSHRNTRKGCEIFSKLAVKT